MIFHRFQGVTQVRIKGRGDEESGKRNRDKNIHRYAARGGKVNFLESKRERETGRGREREREREKMHYTFCEKNHPKVNLTYRDSAYLEI